MRVKHLDDLYTWRQIRMLQLIHDFSRYNGFIPIAMYAPGGGRESHYGGRDEHFGWYGKQSPYYAKRLWEAVRKELRKAEYESLAFDVVGASECFNTIRFRNPEKAQGYVAEFRRLLKAFADEGKVKSSIGRAPVRQHPWNPEMRYEEVIVADDAEYTPNRSHAPQFDNTIPDYSETDPLPWSDVAKYFVELTEDELAFLNGENFINKSPTQLDRELFDACRGFDVEKVRALLSAGANPNATSGSPCFDTLITGVIESAYDLPPSDPKANRVIRIIDLLLSHGCDIDLAPYESCTPMYDAIHSNPSCLEMLIEKGADPNAVSWIGLDDTPTTPLDHAADDIGAYGEDPELKAKFDLIDKAGGKYFSELVPSFYDAEAHDEQP